MNLKPIKTKKDYQYALDRLELIFDAKKGTPQGDELEILGIQLTNMKMSISQLIYLIPLRLSNSGWNRWGILRQIWQK